MCIDYRSNVLEKIRDLTQLCGEIGNWYEQNYNIDTDLVWDT